MNQQAFRRQHRIEPGLARLDRKHDRLQPNGCVNFGQYAKIFGSGAEG